MKKLLLLNIQMFANPKLPTDGTHELIERYPSTIKELFRLKNNLRQFFGSDYEGDPKSGAIKVGVRDTEVTLAAYDVVTGTPITTGTTVYLTIPVDKNNAINELIDGYEAQAVPDGLVAQRLESGAFKMQRQLELDAIATIRDSVAAHDVGNGGGQTVPANPTYETSATILDKDTAYIAMSNSIGEMLDDGVDPQDITGGVSTAMEGLLLQDIRFTNTASEIGSERVMRGVLGMIRGVEVVRSSNLGLVAAAGDNVAKNGMTVEYITYSHFWAQKVDEWIVPPTINDLKDGVHIGASALQGREVYTHALTDSRGARVKARTT
jgi:hypothetical protein